MDWFEILAYAVGILGAVFGIAFWKRWEGVVALLKEFGEAFNKTGAILTQLAQALEDKEFTKEEAMTLLEETSILLREWMDVVTALLALLPKSVKKFFEPK